MYTKLDLAIIIICAVGLIICTIVLNAPKSNGPKTGLKSLWRSIKWSIRKLFW